MLKQLRPAVVSFLVLTLITGVAYPLAVTGIAQAMFPHQANGSLIVKDGKPVGSELIGQPFSDPKYFWGRPSATGPMPYNAAASSGSNQGPLNPALMDAVKGRIQALQGSRSRQHRAGAGRPGHRLRQRARPPHQPGCRRIPGPARGQAARPAAGGSARAGGAAHRGSPVRHPGRAAGERAEAQPGP